MLFKDVLADEQLKKRLAALVDENRISHSQLFLAQRGSHSFALALAYAQYICCEDRHDGDSCGKCHSCIMFEKLQHPDLHLIFPNCTALHVKKDPESKAFMNEFRQFVLSSNYHLDYDEWTRVLKSERKQISINIRDCADIIAQNNTRSYENGYKIYILWMAEKLSYDAAPKLLKTLEEPESKTLFILLAENSVEILPTILSRTQLVKVPPLKEEVIREHLVEDDGLNPAEAADIAAISEGSYTKALMLAKDSDQLHHKLTQYNIFMQCVVAHARQESLEKINFPRYLDLIAALTKEGHEEQKRFIAYISRMFRNELLLHQKTPSLVKSTGEERKVLGDFIQYFTVKNAAPLNKECDLALYHIERNVNPTLVFTDFFFKISKLLSNR